MAKIRRTGRESYIWIWCWHDWWYHTYFFISNILTSRLYKLSNVLFVDGATDAPTDNSSWTVEQWCNSWLRLPSFLKACLDGVPVILVKLIFHQICDQPGSWITNGSATKQHQKQREYSTNLRVTVEVIFGLGFWPPRSASLVGDSKNNLAWRPSWTPHCRPWV